MKKTFIIFISFLLSYLSFSADITDNSNNYYFGQTVTLSKVVFNFPTNTPVNGYTLKIDGIGTATTNYYWDIGGSSGGIPEAPSNGQIYARQDAAWMVATNMGFWRLNNSGQLYIQNTTLFDPMWKTNEVGEVVLK